MHRPDCYTPPYCKFLMCWQVYYSIRGRKCKGIRFVVQNLFNNFRNDVISPFFRRFGSNLSICPQVFQPPAVAADLLILPSGLQLSGACFIGAHPCYRFSRFKLLSANWIRAGNVSPFQPTNHNELEQYDILSATTSVHVAKQNFSNFRDNFAFFPGQAIQQICRPASFCT